MNVSRAQLLASRSPMKDGSHPGEILKSSLSRGHHHPIRRQYAHEKCPRQGRGQRWRGGPRHHRGGSLSARLSCFFRQLDANLEFSHRNRSHCYVIAVVNYVMKTGDRAFRVNEKLVSRSNLMRSDPPRAPALAPCGIPIHSGSFGWRFDSAFMSAPRPFDTGLIRSINRPCGQ
ncbi:MAG: hypothetical protein JWM55_1873 [Acidimicrobiaceae bacterium]|nr:hypothetical protein [Acidimicrobiaceae bacterium]